MMKKITPFSILFLTVLCCLFCISCTDDPIQEPGTGTENGSELNLYVGFETMTRVSELPDPDSINDPGTDGLYHIGLYVYYTEDYTDGDLSKPYIRNMECEIRNGKLVPVLEPGESVNNEDIFIYDEMTLVAFYPYNRDVIDFTVPEDEEEYPITRVDYSEQQYIPYRGEVKVNPTNAYFIQLTLYPKHTFKMEIILVSDDPTVFNDGSPDIKILPAMDPVDNTNPTASEGKRDVWQVMTSQPNTGGGKHVRKYVAYLWRTDQLNRIIERNDVLFQNGDFTLLATERVNTREQRIYRYGYNYSTGESFIPTSSTLINDAASLQAVNNGVGSHVYQVCDIDLTGVPFSPLYVINYTYDGGGHSISNMTINSSNGAIGLFGQLLGNSNLRNVNLINPVVNVVNGLDSCYVGALCGRVNNILSDDDILNLYGSVNLPDNLSEVVKQAILAGLLTDAYNSQAQVIACRVENPVINVTAKDPRVGAVCGGVGNRSNNGTYTFKGTVWDTYSLGGSITVNENNRADNTGAEVGGFCGLNEFYITRCYTTIEAADITAQIDETIVNGDGTTTIVQTDIWQGFANQGTLYSSSEGAGIVDCYAVAPDTNPGVSIMPGAWPSGWVSYTGIWPINTVSWTNSAANKYWYTLGSPGVSYPALQWERW